MDKAEFLNLHNHTEYSILDSLCRITELLDMAKEYKMSALAITDKGNMFGAIEFFDEAKKKGVKPIIGCEVTKPCQLILLAKNETGYRNLMQIVSHDSLDEALLKKYHQGLIALCGYKEDSEDAIVNLRDLFGDGNFYMEIPAYGLENERQVIPQTVELAKTINVPVVATSESHYLRKEDHNAFRFLQAIKSEIKIGDTKPISDQLYFRSPEEMIKLFSDYPEAIKNTLEIAEKCNLELSFDKLIIPEAQVPTGYNSDTYLEHLCHEGLPNRYSHITQRIRERLQHELRMIKQTGFSSLFLIVRDVIDYAHKNGIAVGPGRGSSSGSIVSYLLGITQIDPLKYDLLFERFLNPDRAIPPDFDIDFGLNKQKDVFNYLTEKYGVEQTARIVSFIRINARIAIRDVGHAMDLLESEVDRIAGLIPLKPGMTIQQAIRDSSELKKIASADEIKDLIDIATSLEGLPRKAIVHAAGIVIADNNITQYTPVFKPSESERVTQYDMRSLEKVGIDKLDILGFDCLSEMQKALTLIEEKHNVRLDLNNLPMNDKATYDLLCSGNTEGLFQVNSEGITNLLIKLRPRSFEELIPIPALYRPGPINSGMMDMYIEHKTGATPIEYIHPILETILSKTYGTIIYQEQIMQIIHEVAGLPLGKADVLRRAMGKRLTNDLETLRRDFLDGVNKNEIPVETAKNIFSQLVLFSSITYNRAHSTAYAMITYQSAYLKAHYPEEFAATK